MTTQQVKCKNESCGNLVDVNIERSNAKRKYCTVECQRQANRPTRRNPPRIVEGEECFDPNNYFRDNATI